MLVVLQLLLLVALPQHLPVWPLLLSLRPSLLLQLVLVWLGHSCCCQDDDSYTSAAAVGIEVVATKAHID